MDNAELSSALVGALIAAGLAAAGYVSKLAVEAWQAWRSEQRRRHARMLELDALLTGTQTVFATTMGLVHRLAKHLQAANPDVETTEGFEHLFTTQHATFDKRATDLHTVIRGYTMYGLAPLNEQLLTWLRTDVHELTPRPRSTPNEKALALGLRQLERHLVLWLAKYPAWMTDQPAHALVFLADEKRDGQGFPPGLDHKVRAVLAERGIDITPVDDE